jgi:hypothetical protein
MTMDLIRRLKSEGDLVSTWEGHIEILSDPVGRQLYWGTKDTVSRIASIQCAQGRGRIWLEELMSRKDGSLIRNRIALDVCQMDTAEMGKVVVGLTTHNTFIVKNNSADLNVLATNLMRSAMSCNADMCNLMRTLFVMT